MQEFRDKKKRGERITALTAYDYPTARLLDESGIDMILVGDSLGMVVLGYNDTTRVTLEEMLHHIRAAARGVKRALLIGDLPIHTYDTPVQAVASARALIEAGAQAVKLEGGVSHVPQIVRDGVAVEKAGAFAVVLEIVSPETARQITSALQIPTIGIGSGEHCDGQILVTHDLIGLFPWFTPKFVSPEARVAEEIRRAVQVFIGRTKAGGS